jgi:hypothetical protein
MKKYLVLVFCILTSSLSVWAADKALNGEIKGEKSQKQNRMEVDNITTVNNPDIKPGKPFPTWFPINFPIPEISRLDRADDNWSPAVAMEQDRMYGSVLFECTQTPKEVRDFYFKALTDAGMIRVSDPKLHSATDGKNGYFDIEADIPKDKRDAFGGFASVSINIRPQTGSLDSEGMVYVRSEFVISLNLPFEY